MNIISYLGNIYITVILAIVASIGWYMYLTTNKKYIEVKTTEVLIEKIQVGFDDICLDFVQALLIRGKHAGAKRLMDDERLNLNDDVNKIYYYLMRIVLNYFIGDIKEGRKWIEYAIGFFKHHPEHIVFEKDISKINTFISDNFAKEEKNLMFDTVDLINGKLDVMDYEENYNRHKKIKQAQIQDKTKGFQTLR